MGTVQKEEINKLVGSNIRQLRLKREIPQQKVADMIQLPRSSYSSIENGKAAPDPATLYKLAVVLGCSILEFFPAPGTFQKPRIRYVVTKAGKPERKMHVRRETAEVKVKPVSITAETGGFERIFEVKPRNVAINNRGILQ